MLGPGKRFSWQWTQDGEVTGSIKVEAQRTAVVLDYRFREGDEWRPMRYAVQLSETPCHLGGTRHWFLCPARGCGRRVALLYGGRVFACRHCHRLAYQSQRENASDRAARRVDRLRVKLGWGTGILNGTGCKPKGMHWRTFERMTKDHDRLVDQSCELMLSHIRASFGADWPEELPMLAQIGGRNGGRRT